MFVLGRPAFCVLAGEEAAPERGPTEDCQIQRVRHRDELALDRALDEAVLDLDPCKWGPPPQVRQSIRPRHNPGRGIRDPNVENLPRADLVIEYPHQFVNRGQRIPDMNPVQVDVVGVQTAEAALEGLDQALAVVAARIRIAGAEERRVLRRNHVAIALACYEFPEVALAHATAVVDGGVDEIAAGFGKYVEDPSRFRP